MLEISALDLDEIVTALQSQDGYEQFWLIDPATGEIAFASADLDPDLDLADTDLIRIDPLPSRVWYRDMEDFANEMSDERAGRRLARAIQGRGAFRRFKDELHDEYPHLLELWYAFSGRRGIRRAVEWLDGDHCQARHGAGRNGDTGQSSDRAHDPRLACLANNVPPTRYDGR